MADSAVRSLLLSTALWTLLRMPEIQAQNTSVLTSQAMSASAVSPSSSLASPQIFFPNSTIGIVSSTNLSPTYSIKRDTVTTEATGLGTIVPTSTSQQLTSSTPVSPSQSVTSSPTTKDSKSDEEDKESFTITEYILIACLGAFVFVLIAIIYLVVQLTRLNKSVRSLKATSQR